MKGPAIDKLVHEYMFPKLRPSDPSNFQAFLTRHLVGEVRSETQAFYGHLETQEAKYPGLDYNDRIHRIRLSRYPWHRRLFRAFDGLGLTPAEISALTRWEGTRWAKEKYEHEHDVVIRDTTADGIPTWDDELGYAVGDEKPAPRDLDDPAADSQDEDEEAEIEAPPRVGSRRNGNRSRRGGQQEAEEEVVDDDDDDDDDVASESDIQSVGIELNARLRAGAARREAGETTAVLDEEWEQWLKHVVDSGLLHDNMSEQSFRQFVDTTVIPAGLVPVEIMSAARAGNWSRVPEFLRNLLRRTVESERRAAEVAEAASAAVSAARRRSLSGLRLPVGDAPASQVAADAQGA